MAFISRIRRDIFFILVKHFVWFLKMFLSTRRYCVQYTTWHTVKITSSEDFIFIQWIKPGISRLKILINLCLCLSLSFSLSLSVFFDFYVNIQIFRRAPLTLHEFSLVNKMLHASLTYIFFGCCCKFEVYL